MQRDRYGRLHPQRMVQYGPLKTHLKILFVHVGLSTSSSEQIKNTSPQVVHLCLVRKLKFYG